MCISDLEQYDISNEWVLYFCLGGITQNNGSGDTSIFWSHNIIRENFVLHLSLKIFKMQH